MSFIDRSIDLHMTQNMMVRISRFLINVLALDVYAIGSTVDYCNAFSKFFTKVDGIESVRH